jgi:hypothetical protein
VSGWAASAASVLLALSAGLGSGAFAAVPVPGPAAGGAGADSDTVIAAPEGLRVGAIRCERRGVFDPPPPGTLGAVFHFADHLHVRTRETTIRGQILLRPGDPWSQDRAKESERKLRSLDLFDQVAIDARQVGDSAEVSVRTRDSWTTSPEFQLQRGGGHTYGSLELSERNLMGLAKFISIAYREAPEGISRSLEVSDPAIADSRVRALFFAANGSSGVFNTIAVELPFYAEDTRYAFGSRVVRTDNLARLYASGAEVAVFPRDNRRIEAYAGLGRRHDGAIRRLTASWLTLDRRYGPSILTPEAPPEFDGGFEFLHLRRLALEARFWRPHFVERTRVDGLVGVEDFDLGAQFAVSGGFSLEAFGGSDDEGYAALRFGIGTDRHGWGFGWVVAQGSTRILAGPVESIGQIEGRWINQAIPRHTLVLAALGAGGDKTARDFQLSVGGLNGPRAQGVHALSGTEMWRLNAESRWLVGPDLFQVLSVGAAGFWDAARTRGPGSGDPPWNHDVGLGLRLSLPGSSLARVARFDVAWTVSPAGAGPRKPVFSFSSSQAF